MNRKESALAAMLLALGVVSASGAAQSCQLSTPFPTPSPVYKSISLSSIKRHDKRYYFVTTKRISLHMAFTLSELRKSKEVPSQAEASE